MLSTKKIAVGCAEPEPGPARRHRHPGDPARVRVDRAARDRPGSLPNPNP